MRYHDILLAVELRDTFPKHLGKTMHEQKYETRILAFPFLVVPRPKFPSPNSGPMTPSRLVAVPLDHDHRVDATWPFRSDMNGRKVTNLPFKDPFCNLELL